MAQFPTHLHVNLRPARDKLTEEAYARVERGQTVWVKGLEPSKCPDVPMLLSGLADSAVASANARADFVVLGLFCL